MKLVFKKAGYTLIELLVSIGILAMLASAVAPSISKAKKSQEMQQSALGIKTAISNAQSIALAPPTIIGSSGSISNSSSVYKYYGLKFGNDSATGSFFYRLMKVRCITECDNGTGVPDPVDSDLPHVSFDTVKMVSPANSPVYIWFSVGNNPQVTMTDSSGVINSDSDIIITIKSKDDSDGRNLAINQVTGVVNVQDF